MYTYCEGTWAANSIIPRHNNTQTSGLQYRVLIGGACAAFVRAAIETPLE